jgi:small subunit ribosomal protein S17
VSEAENNEEQAASSEQPQDQAPAEEPAAEAPTPTPAPPAEEAEPAEQLSPKELRKRKRALHTGEPGPELSSEERIAARAADRARKAANRRRRRTRARQGHEPGEGTPTAEREPGKKMVRQGTVVSNKADKTITVKLEIVRRHPTYEKVVRRTATVHAHDERNEAHEGDLVRLVESRPLSRTKRWRLVEVLERAR